MRPMKSALSLTTAALVAVTLTACAPRPPKAAPDVRGTVIALELMSEKAEGDTVGRVTIATPETSEASSTLFSARITKKTKLLLRKGKGYSPSTLAEMSSREKVEVWFTGPVMESYPPQGVAEVLVRTGETAGSE